MIIITIIIIIFCLQCYDFNQFSKNRLIFKIVQSSYDTTSEICTQYSHAVSAGTRRNTLTTATQCTQHVLTGTIVPSVTSEVCRPANWSTTKHNYYVTLGFLMVDALSLPSAKSHCLLLYLIARSVSGSDTPRTVM
jgi:hypothetical protein